MKNKFFKISCVLTALLSIFLGLGSYVLKAEAKEETIKIKSAEDLLEFAQNCTLDSWSQGKTVVLQDDIYIGDIAFLPIATFGGIFDGKGHSIIGLEITESVSPAGFFGVLQEGAEVKNLNVLGKVMPSGENNTVGGIVGENYGQLRNCTFTGAVYGTCNVGGVAGVNGTSGSIQNCRVSGDIQGSLRTGGVVGHNQGIIEKCKNDAGVNIAKVDPQISMTDVDLEISMDITQWNGMSMTDAAMDTGGIAGYSTGVIYECTNAGTVGYPHIGYNLGGITGRNCGYIAACENGGQVYGRKDVGGVVGQMEPYVQVELTESAVGEISREVGALETILENTKKHSSENKAALNRRINRIESYLKGLQELLEGFELPELDEISDKQDITEKLEGLLLVDQFRQLEVQMGLVKRQVELLTRETMNSAGTLKGDIEHIISQTEVLSGTMKFAMEQAENLSLSDFVEDISQWDSKKATLGKVSDCVNNGAVCADKNVGGITGSMSMEYELDPEDDLTGKLSMKERRRYQLTDIIQDSINYGSVISKKDYVGGICGRMDIGLIFECVNYGSVSSQKGDYVGGIAGMTGSTIRNCFVKCFLSGENYIGGVVGSGVTEDVTGESSLVSQCYTMVNISNYRQFVGAVAGMNHGQYEDCYFVSESLAGINRISYVGKAEPITHEALQEVNNLPKDFETMEIRSGDGNTDMSDISVVTAIASEEVREDGRPIFLAEGQFVPESSLIVTEVEKNFDPKEMQSFLEKIKSSEVVEQWKVEVPEDGLLIRTMRYLVPKYDADAVDIYIKQDGDWKLAPRDVVGSYLVFNIAGYEAQIAVVTTQYVLGYWVAAVLTLIVLIGGGICVIRKKKDLLKWLIGILALLLCIFLLIIVVVLKDGKLMGGIGAYQLLKQYMEQPKQSWKLTIEAQAGEESFDVEAEIGVTELDGRQVTCIQISDTSVFYAEGILYLENGNAYRASEVSADYGNMLQQLAAMYETLDMEVVKEGQSKKYKVTLREEDAQEMLGYFLPGISAEDLEMQQMQAELSAQEEQINGILLTAKGKLQNEDRTKYEVSAVLIPKDLDAGKLEIPEAVKIAIQKGAEAVQAIITKDVFRLYRGWRNLEKQSTMGAQVYLSADCGPLTLAEDFSFISSKVKNARINSVRKDDFVVYFNEDSICSENGYGVTAKRAQAVDAVELLAIAYELCLQGNFRCVKVNDSYLYSFALDEAGMSEIAELIAKESRKLAIRFENGSVQLVMQDNMLERIRFACDGELDVLLTNVAVALSAEVELQDETQFANYSIPEKVLEKLQKED